VNLPKPSIYREPSWYYCTQKDAVLREAASWFVDWGGFSASFPTWELALDYVLSTQTDMKASLLKKGHRR
jgi:hypothetical protein